MAAVSIPAAKLAKWVWSVSADARLAACYTDLAPMLQSSPLENTVIVVISDIINVINVTNVSLSLALFFFCCESCFCQSHYGLIYQQSPEACNGAFYALHLCVQVAHIIITSSYGT